MKADAQSRLFGTGFSRHEWIRRELAGREYTSYTNELTQLLDDFDTAIRQWLDAEIARLERNSDTLAVLGWLGFITLFGSSLCMVYLVYRTRLRSRDEALQHINQ